MAKSNDKLTPVGPGAEETFAHEEDEEERPEGQGTTTQQQQTSPEEGDSDDEESSSEQEAEGDERAAHSEDDEEDGESRQTGKHARRQRQKQKRREQARAREVELNFLRQRNEQLERQFSATDQRLTQSEVLAIDSRISQAQDQIRQAEEVYAAAIEKGAGTDAAEAQRIRDDLRDGLQRLTTLRSQTVDAAKTRATAPQTVDPRVTQRAREWARENRDWFDPSGRDEASRIAYVIEQGVSNEGRYDASSDEYWEEVDRRIAKRLPDVVGTSGGEDDDEGERATRRNGNGNGKNTRKASGPTFRTGGRERSLNRGEVYVSAERRRAMEESGVWENEELRNKYLKAYQRYDREHGRRH